MLVSSTGLSSGSMPPPAEFDVSHASASPPPLEVPKAPAEAPVEKTRSWQVKGPLSFYALHFDRMEADFKKEQERLKKNLPIAFALKARYEWLNRLILSLSEERLPEIDAEWDAVRAQKTQLQTSQNESRKREVESDARALLPVWQSPVKVPEALKTQFKRVRRVLDIQGRLNEDASRRLGEFQKIDGDQKILEAKLLEIEKLERAIGEKYAALKRSTYASNEIASLKTECSIDKSRYPNAETSFQYIKDKFLSAEKVWNETRIIIEKVRGQFLEWAKVMLPDSKVTFTSLSRELEVLANFQRAFANQQDLQCGRFTEAEFKEKAEYLARFGLLHPEVKDWIDPAQEELEKRLKFASHALVILKPLLAEFEKEIAGFHEQKGRLSPPPEPVLLVQESKGSPSLLGRLTGKAKKTAVELFEAPGSIDWSKVVPVPVRSCMSTVLASDRNERIRPPVELRRNLSNVQEDKWGHMDHWDHCLTAVWPKAMSLLNQSFTLLNSSIARLEIQNYLLQHAIKNVSIGQRPWLVTLYWQLRDTSRDLSMQRTALQKEYDQIQTKFGLVICLMDDAISKQPPASSAPGPLDAHLLPLQQKMEEAVQDLRYLSTMLQIEWEYGLKAQKIQQDLVALEPICCPEGRLPAVASEPSDEPKPRHITFKAVLAAQTVLERKALLAAMAFEGYCEEKKKLQKHDLSLKEQAEQLDQLVEHLRMIYANWQHLRNAAEAITFAKPYLTDATVKLLILPLMVAFNQIKKDVESYGPLIPEFTKKLEENVSWLDEKLSQDKVEWRIFQERYLLRTPEGNRVRNLQIASEIAKYRLIISEIDSCWLLGKENCKIAMARINALLTKKEGDEPIQMIAENPYELKGQPIPSIPLPSPVPSQADAKPSAPNHDWFVVKGGDEDPEADIVNFSMPFGFGKPAAESELPSQAASSSAFSAGSSGVSSGVSLSASQSASSSASSATSRSASSALSPSAVSGHAIMTSSDFDRLEKQVEALLPPRQNPAPASPLPFADLSASLSASGDSPSPTGVSSSISVVHQDE